jgi:hypothetical protein
MLGLFVLATSITGDKSVIDAPFTYSHHQRVTGLIFDAVIVLALITWGAIVAYRNFGPPRKGQSAPSK